MMTRQADDLCCSYFVFEARLHCRCRCRQLVSFRLGEVSFARNVVLFCTGTALSFHPC